MEIIIKEHFLTAVQLATELGVDRKTIFNRIQRGEIEAQRVGRTTFIERSEVERLKLSLLVQDGD